LKIQKSESIENNLREDESNKDEVSQESERKILAKEFNHSESQNIYKDADPTHNNSLAAILELYSSLFKQTGSKSNFEAVILMRARKVLKNNELTFSSDERNIFLLEEDRHKRLISTCFSFLFLCRRNIYICLSLTHSVVVILSNFFTP
jgi:hypothetical protein